MTANGLFGWNNDDYRNVAAGLPSKYFNRFHIRIGLDWAIKSWLLAGIYYDWQDQVASNKAAYGSSAYTANKVAGFIQGTY